jgi:hypothetical protein
LAGSLARCWVFGFLLSLDGFNERRSLALLSVQQSVFSLLR